MPADADALQADVKAAVADVLGRHGELATKWVLAAESLSDDGERGLWLSCSEGMKPWESIGLFGFALAKEQALITAREIREYDD